MSTPLKLPATVRPGQPVKASDYNLLLAALATLSADVRAAEIRPGPDIAAARNAGGTTLSLKKRRGPGADTLPPLWPVLAAKSVGEATVLYCTVTRGLVHDHATIGAPGAQTLLPVEISNLLTNGEPTEFSLTVGDRIYVVHQQTDKGAVKTATGVKPAIVVTDDDLISIHYDPPVGDETSGTEGYTAVLLAELIEEDGTPVLLYHKAGDNIDHWRELPVFKKAAGDYDSFKEYDFPNGRFLTKGHTGKTMATGLKTIDYTDTDDELQPYTIGVHINHEIWAFSVTLTGGEEIGEEPEHIIYIRDGLNVAVGTGNTLPEGIDNTCSPTVLKTHRCYAGD